MSYHKFMGTGSLVLLVNFGYSQSELLIKMYQNSDFYERSEYLYDQDLGQLRWEEHFLSSFDRFSLGLGVVSSKWCHEIELSFIPDFPPLAHVSRIPKDHEGSSANFISL